ncbi:MAG: response regulator [Bacteroidia bacterium]|nr:response regulator [Bacteroidia bacterium]
MPEPLRILLIEDDEVDTLAVKRGLKSSEFNVDLSNETNASRGMELLQEKTFDCIFLDYMLPGKDGLSFLREVRDMGIQTPIVVITSKGDEKIAVEMMKAGASDYIPKSLLTSEGLSQSLRGALRHSKLIKEKLATERALREKEEQLKTVIESAPLIMYVLNLEGVFLLSEGAGLKKLGVKPGESVGQSAFRLYRNHPGMIRLINKALRGETFTDQIKIGEFYFEVNSTPLFDENGKLMGSTGLAVDITTHIEAERKLYHAKQLAEKSAKSKEDFLANMSHEIRTPMNAIMGFSKLLIQTPLTAEQREYLKAINSSGDTLMVIINDILDLSKIEAGKLRFESRDFDLRELVSSLVDVFQPRLREKNLTLKTQIDPGVPQIVVGDPVRLNQVLLNLVGNAIKFTEKGSVRIEINEIAQSEGKSKLEFHVTDSGIGIAEDKQDEIFASFAQASTDTTRKYGGTGLGLTISKRIIELQGGKIGVKSEVGVGSDFYFILDFLTSSSEAGQKDSPLEVRIQPRPDLHILLVEDNAMNQILAKKVLESFGMKITVAQNGQDALEKLREFSFNLVLMDVQMPIMDGYEATRIIRRDFPENLRNIPIIALTAHAVSEEIDKCRAAGMDDYSSKPFQPETLYAQIVGLTGPATQPRSLPSILDLTYLHDLAEGSNEFLAEMMDLFLERIPTTLDEMGQALRGQNWKQLYHQAHSIKPTYLTFGIPEGKELASELEKIGKAGEDKDGKGQELLAELKTLSGVAVAEVKQLRESLPLPG